MNTKKIGVIAVSLIAILALASSAACAQSSGASGEQKKAFMEKKEAKRQELYKELNLSEEQKKLLEENRNKHKERMKTLFAGMKEKMTFMRQELQKDTLDTAKINQTNNELKKLQTDMLDYRLDRILEVRKILTPEQFKKFMSKIEEPAGRFKNKHKGS